MADVLTAEQTTLSLEQLQALYPAPPPELRAALLQGQTTEHFKEMGARMESDPVVAEGSNVVAKAHQFLLTATEPQRKTLRGCSRNVLGMAIHELVTLKTLANSVANVTNVSKTEKAAREKQAVKTRARAMGLERQAETLLRRAAFKDPALLAKVDGYCAAVEDHVGLSQRMQNKAALIREWCSSTDASMKVKVEFADLDVTYAAALEEAARQVLETGNAAQAAVRRGVEQGEQDVQDGLCMFLTLEIARAFDAAHDLDPTIPRVVPVMIRRALGYRAPKKPVKAPAPVTPPTTPAT